MTAPNAPNDEPVTPARGDGLVRRYRLDIGYDGTDFRGWARQPGLRTVCGVIEDTVALVLRREPVQLTVAGRTDAGVHATGQVAHVDLPDGALRSAVSGRSPRAEEPDTHRATLDRVRYRLARALPDDVRVRDIRPVPSTFDARFSALCRHYRYLVCDAPWAIDPLRRRHVLAWPRQLDLDALNEAAAGLVGEHDFAAFCRRREGATTVRRLQRLRWRREPDGTLAADVSADAFCHSMVRSLVGALLAVGEGRKPVGWPADLLSLAERSSSVAVAAAHGLTLVGVDYPPDDQLAARAEITRAVRA